MGGETLLLRRAFVKTLLIWPAGWLYDLGPVLRGQSREVRTAMNKIWASPEQAVADIADGA
jgi:hypothetical protein